MNLVDLLISIVLALVMFGVGTSLQFSDFRQIIAKPRPVGVGLLLQMIFLPVVAFVFCLVLPISDDLKVGLIILSLCPGGATSNFISYLLDLKTALSISLTAVNSILILVTIPVGVSLASNYFSTVTQNFQMPVRATILNILLVILLPALLGLLANARFEELIPRFKGAIKVVTTILLAVVFSIKFFADEDNGGSGITTDDIFLLLPITLAFHLFTMIFSYWVTYREGIKPLDAITIAVEVGLQNTTLALLVSSVLLDNTEMSKPALVYALFSFFTTLGFGYFAKKRIATKNKERVIA